MNIAVEETITKKIKNKNEEKTEHKVIGVS